MPDLNDPAVKRDLELIQRLSQAANGVRQMSGHEPILELALSTLTHAYNTTMQRGPDYAAGFANGVLVSMNRAGEHKESRAWDLAMAGLFIVDSILPTLGSETDLSSSINGTIDELNALAADVELEQA